MGRWSGCLRRRRRSSLIFRLKCKANILNAIDESAAVVVGGDSAELISAGDGADTMYGGGGADTYSIGSGDADSTTLVSDAFGVKGDVINEIGGDLGSSLVDSIQFTALEAIDSVTFERTQIRFVKP